MHAPNAVSESESVAEAEDFYPYGGQRIDTKTNYGGEKRKYAGTEYDSLSALNSSMTPTITATSRDIRKAALLAKPNSRKTDVKTAELIVERVNYR